MNFAAHSILGLLAGAIAALAAASIAPTTLESLPLPFLVPAAVLVLVYLGAVYPDVDVHGSIPRRRLLPYLQALAVGGIALAAAVRWDWFVGMGRALFAMVDVTAGPILAGTGAGLVAAGLAVLTVEPALAVVTGPHRTWTHSIAANAVLAATAALAIWLASPLPGADRAVVSALPLAFVVGVAVHQFADDVG